MHWMGTLLTLRGTVGVQRAGCHTTHMGFFEDSAGSKKIRSYYLFLCLFWMFCVFFSRKMISNLCGSYPQAPMYGGQGMTYE